MRSFEYLCSMSTATRASLSFRTSDFSRELHRDRREPLVEAPRHQVAERRPGDAQPVDAVVAVEALVFGDDEGIAHDLGDLADLGDRPALQTDLGHEPAVDGEELRRLARHVPLEHVDRGAAATGTDEGPARVDEAQAEGG